MYFQNSNCTTYFQGADKSVVHRITFLSHFPKINADLFLSVFLSSLSDFFTVTLCEKLVCPGNKLLNLT